MNKRISQALTLALFSVTYASTVYALPTDGQVTAGDASISTNAAKDTMNIDQKTSKVAIDWKGFDIAKQETVNFNQPSSSAIALNRVVGNNASEIYGHLNANGQVFLINQNGILFGKGAEVNVGGLVATTHNISNEEFMNSKGSYTFAGDSAKAVKNAGDIKAEGGLVALLAADVSNEGTIATTQGTTALAAGKNMTIDYESDGKINLVVNKAVANAKALNAGTIKADGGYVVMTARDANETLNTVVNNTGVIEAKSIKNINGTIYLDGGDQGVVEVGGTLDASGDAAGETGGSVTVKGQYTDVHSGTSLKASGDKAGGFIETSGKALLIGDGVDIDTSSAHGAIGEWLIDPMNLTIKAVASDTTAFLNDTYTGTKTNSVLSVKTLNDALNNKSNVLIQTNNTTGNQAGDINVDADIVKSAGGATTLTLQAGRDINLNGSANSQEAVIKSTAGALNVVLEDGLASPDTTGYGAITLLKDIFTNGGSLTFGTEKSAGTYIGGTGTRTISTNGGALTFNGDTAFGNVEKAGSYDNAGLVIDTSKSDGTGGSVTFNGKLDSGNMYEYHAYTQADEAAWAAIKENYRAAYVQAYVENYKAKCIRNGTDYNEAVAKAAANKSYDGVTYKNWEAARRLAESGTGADVGDTYLTTITSGLENARVRSAATVNGSNQKAWAGAEAVDNLGTDENLGGNSDWRWVTGPEGLANGGAGTPFYYRDASGDKNPYPGHPGRDTTKGQTNLNPADKDNHVSGTVDGMFNNFDDQGGVKSEPNNYKTGNECYLEVNHETYSKWNDFAGNNTQIQGYVKETNLTAGDLSIKAGSGAVTFKGDVGASKVINNLTVVTTGDVTAAKTVHTQEAFVVKQAKDISVGGMIYAGYNDAGEKTAGEKGQVSLEAVGENTTNGIDAAGKVNLVSTAANGKITMNGKIKTDSKAADAVVLDAKGSFANKTKNTLTDTTAAITTGEGGSWKVYSAAPYSDTFGDNLLSNTNAIWHATSAEYARTTAEASGGRYIFAYQPTITITANDASKRYGETSSGAGVRYATDSDLSSFTAFTDGANTLSARLQGTTTLSSAGFPALSRVGTYTILAAGQSSNTGYKVVYAPGTLTVTDTTTTVPEHQKEDYRNPSNQAGTGDYALGEGTRGVPGVDRVAGLVSAELPFFKVANKQVSNYGTYNITETPDEVKVVPTAKHIPEPNKVKNQYRALVKSYTLAEGTGSFNLVYDGTDFNIYPVDAQAKTLLQAGDPKHNVEVEAKALYSSFHEMGLVLDDLDAVYVHTDATEAEAK